HSSSNASMQTHCRNSTRKVNPMPMMTVGLNTGIGPFSIRPCQENGLGFTIRQTLQTIFTRQTQGVGQSTVEDSNNSNEKGSTSKSICCFMQTNNT
ncbi:MAG: hypothetical protein ACKO66_00190, partial [Flavobacteriales bacterium]